MLIKCRLCGKWKHPNFMYQLKWMKRGDFNYCAYCFDHLGTVTPYDENAHDWRLYEDGWPFPLSSWETIKNEQMRGTGRLPLQLFCKVL